MKNLNRALSFFVIAAILLTMIPLNVFAAGNVTATNTTRSYSLTINYLSSSNSKVAQSYVSEYESGEAYSVTSPVIEGYNVSTPVVEGTITEDTTVTVRYSAQASSYTVNYQLEALDGSYSTSASTIITADVYVGQRTNAVEWDSAPAGYTLLPIHQSTVLPNGATAVNVKYQREFHSVILNSGDSATYIKPISGKYGATVSLSSAVPDWTGNQPNRFVGWFTAEVGGTQVTSVTIGTADTQVYAHWTPDTAAPVKYRVYYWLEKVDATTGQNQNQNDTGNYELDSMSDIASAQLANITWAGLTGAAQKSYTGFTHKTAGSLVDTRVQAADGTYILNVYYTRNVYTISVYYYNWPNYPATPTGTTTRKYGSSLANVWSISPYNQKTWSKTQYSGYTAGGMGGGTYAVTTQTPYTLETTMPANNLILYDYLMSAGLGGGEVTVTSNYHLQALDGTYPNNADSLKTKNSQKMTITGWQTFTYNLARGELFEGFTLDTANASNSTVAALNTAPYTLNFYYKRNAYNLSFSSEGSPIKTVSKLYQANISNADLPAEPTRTNYTFGGWYSNPDGTGVAFANGTMPAKNVTYYARWTRLDSYTVNFHYNVEDTAVDEYQTVAKGTTAANVVPPANEGYNFAGWYLNAEGTGEPFNFATKINEETHLYAKWISQTGTQLTYTIRYIIVGSGGEQFHTDLALTGTDGTVAYIYPAVDSDIEGLLDADLYYPTPASPKIISFNSTDTEADRIKTFYYDTRAISYTVNYLFNGVVIKEQFTGTTGKLKQLITPPAIEGYYAPSAVWFIPDANDASSNIINLNYRKIVTITAVDNSKVYGDDDPTLEAIVTGLKLNSGDVLDYDVVRDSGEDVDHYEITFIPGDNPNYYITWKSADFEITPKEITIVPVDDNKFYGDTDPELTATLDDGSAVPETIEYTVERVAGENVGTYTLSVTIDQDDPNYTIDYSATGTFTIKPKAITIVAVNAEKTFGDADPSFTATIKGGAAVPNTIAYTVARANIGEDVGDYTLAVTLTTPAANTNYTITLETGTFTINPKEITIVPVDADKVFGEADPSFTATLKGGAAVPNTIAYTVARANKGEDVGDYELAVTLTTPTANGNYTIKLETGTFTINPNEITIVAVDAEKTFGDTDPTFTATLKDGSPVPASVAYTVARANTSEDVGDYTLAVTLTTPTANGNYTIKLETGTFTINPKAITIVAVDAEKTFGDADPTFTATLKGGAAVPNTIAYTVARANTSEDVGDYTLAVTLTTPAANTNYTITLEAGTFTIDPKAITIVAVDAEKTFGDADPTFTATIKGGAAVPNTIAYTVARANTSEDVGDYTLAVTLTTPAANTNYTITLETGTFTINPKAITIVAVDAEKTIGDADPTFTATLKGGAAVPNTIAYTVARANTSEDVGDYTLAVTLTTPAANTNYTITLETGTFTINPKAITIIAVDAEKTFGDADPTFTATIKGGAAVPNTIAYTVARANTSEDVGDYTLAVTLTTPAANTNYTITLETGTFTINPKEITIVADPAGKVYGGTDPEVLTAKLSDGSAVPSSIAYTVARDSGENVGEYDINVTVTTGDSNYVISTSKGVFAISPKAITIVAVDSGKSYGDAEPELTATLDDESAIPDEIVYTVTRTAGENVGEYEITVTAEENENYEVELIAGTFTIIPKIIEIKGSIMTKEYGDPDPEFKKIVNIEDYLPEGIDYNLDRDAGENVGEYDVEVGFTENPNYTIIMEPVKFVVVPKSVIIKAEPKSKTYGDADPTLTNTIDCSGNRAVLSELLYSLDREDGEDVGIYLIDVELEENPNFDVTVETANLVVNPKKLVVEADNKSKVKGAADPALTYKLKDGYTLVTGDTLAGLGITASREAGEEVGSYKIILAAGENANYEIELVNATLTITASEDKEEEKKDDDKKEEKKEDKGKGINTGDAINYIIYIVIAVVCLAAVILLLVLSKKKKKTSDK
ncbi:MAG: InlB B-repeat-containing protein [Oscillospiraceae bacterium]|jgi:uncharacterized repeat protein (TIGR02543 family)|nr:InlB B-repeat-containing protein [Oscillospiraceae bacterium]